MIQFFLILIPTLFCLQVSAANPESNKPLADAEENERNAWFHHRKMAREHSRIGKEGFDDDVQEESNDEGRTERDGYKGWNHQKEENPNSQDSSNVQSDVNFN